MTISTIAEFLVGVVLTVAGGIFVVFAFFFHGPFGGGIISIYGLIAACAMGMPICAAGAWIAVKSIRSPL